ncbi:unnamed protein product [Prunus armeniaca]
MNKSQAFHKMTKNSPPKHLEQLACIRQLEQLAWNGQLEQLAFIGQLRQLGAAKRGVLHQPKGRRKLHSINGQRHTHSRGIEIDIHFIRYSYTHSDSILHHKERRELVEKEGELGAVLGDG